MNYCFNCGKELPIGSNFCPFCGKDLTILYEDKSLEVTETKTENESNQNGDDKSLNNQKSLFRLLVSPTIYYPAMVVLVIVAVIFARFNKMKDYDLAKLMGVKESYVLDYFNVPKNEMGMYPSDNAITILCKDGVCEWVNLSNGLDNYNKYNFAGAKVGDGKEKVKATLTGNGFDFVKEYENKGTQYLIFTEENRYTITALFENNEMQSILYTQDSIDEMTETDLNESDDNNISNPALKYQGAYTNIDNDNYWIVFRAYSSVKDGIVGIITYYYGELEKSSEQVYMCTDAGDWKDWNYDQIYILGDSDEFKQYLCFSEDSRGNLWASKNSEYRNLTDYEFSFNIR